MLTHIFACLDKNGELGQNSGVHNQIHRYHKNLIKEILFMSHNRLSPRTSPFVIATGLLASSLFISPVYAKTEKPPEAGIAMPIETAPILNDQAACRHLQRFNLKPNGWAYIVNFNVVDRQGRPMSCLIINGDEPFAEPARVDIQPCEMGGKGLVIVNGHTATFDGTAYLDCPFNLTALLNNSNYDGPSQRRIANTLNQSAFWLFADVRGLGPHSEAPLIHHPKFKMTTAVRADSPNRYQLSLKSQLFTRQVVGSIPIAQTFNNLKLVSSCLDMVNCRPNLTFFYNGVMTSALYIPTMTPPLVTLPGPENRIYIGGHPNIPGRFNGTLNEVIVDPDCCM